MSCEHMFFAAKTQTFDSKFYGFRIVLEQFRTVLKRFNLKLVDLFTFSAGRSRPLLQRMLVTMNEIKSKREPKIF